MKPRKATSDTIVGLFVMTGLIALVLVTFVIRQDLFGRTVTVRAKFESVSGLEVGAPVLVSGVRGGRVVDIDYNKNLLLTYPEQLKLYPLAEGESDGTSVDAAAERPVVVKMMVKYSLPIYSNSRVRLVQQGFIGDKRVESDPGDPETGGTRVESGDVLVGAPILDMEKVIDEAKGVAGEVRRAFEGIAEIVNDNETLDSVRTAIEKAGVTLDKVNVYLAENQDAVKGAVENVRDMSASVRDFSDAARELVDEEGEARLLIADVRQAVTEIRADVDRIGEKADKLLGSADETIQNLNAKSGEVGDAAVDFLKTTKENQEQLLADIDRTKAEVDEILRKINEGEGVAGMLLNDPQPFLDLKASIEALHHAVLGRRPGIYDAPLTYDPRTGPNGAEDSTPNE